KRSHGSGSGSGLTDSYGSGLTVLTNLTTEIATFLLTSDRRAGYVRFKPSIECISFRRRWSERVAHRTGRQRAELESNVRSVKGAAMEMKKTGWLLVSSSVLLLGGIPHASAQTITSNQTGTNNGFFYSYWKAT